MGKPPPKIIVVDTNVLIRATFRKRSPASLRIYQAIKEQTCLLATSPAILAEIREVISRDYIIALTHTTPAQRTRYMHELQDISMLTTGQGALTQQSRDRNDNKFLVCASEAQADYLITSDADLLDLKTHEGTRILPPQEFVARLDAGTL
jgi:putative PIN family toxin of toxin-antitoxin system